MTTAPLPASRRRRAVVSPLADHRRLGSLVLARIEAAWRSTLWIVPGSLLPPLALALLVARWGIDVPFWDQWALVPHLADLWSGELELVDLWGLHNEHRPLVPKLVMLALARLTGWNVRAELGCILLLAAGVFAALGAILLRETGLGRRVRRTRCGLLPLMALLVFGLTQVENWTWGWQIQIQLNLLAVVLGVLVLLGPVGSRGRFLVAAALGWIATYSFANGLLYWIALLPLAARRGPKREQRRTLWLSSAAACWLTFIPLAGEASPELHLEPLRLLLYSAAYLGAPLFPSSVAGAALAGLLGLLAVAYLLTRLLGRVRPEGRPWVLAWAALAAYAAASALLTGFGRAELGISQALSSRYITISQLLWIALLALLVCWAENGNDPALARRRWVIPLLLGLAALPALRSLESLHRFPGQYGYKLAAARALVHEPGRPELGRLHPDPELVRHQRQVLLRLRLSSFRDASRFEPVAADAVEVGPNPSSPEGP